jgi:protein-tyrosine phosphatase
MQPAVQGILVLCEGNHCRSPMAEALLQQALGPGFRVSSAGLGALVDHPPHEEALRLLAAVGIDLAGHRGRQFTAELALGADLILVMDQAQKDTCERWVPSIRGRVYLLGHWLPSGQQQIADPIHRPETAHRQAFEHIQRAIPPWLVRLGAAPPAAPLH